MIWAGIADQTIVEPFKVGEAVKPNSANHCDFINKTFFALFKSQSRSFKMKCVIMHYNVPFHVSNITRELYEQNRFKGEQIIEWPLSCLYLNLISNQWSVVKKKLYKGGKQYESKPDLWEVIKTTM